MLSIGDETSVLAEDFVFSQTSLQDYLDCPRRFELKYILGRRWPAPEVENLLEFERRMAQGERFHHLIHQHQVGIDASALSESIDDDDVRRWFEAYRRSGLADVPGERRPETTLIVSLGDHLLLAKFDLLVIEPGGRALIVDWKTGRQAPRPDRLVGRMQTVVYRCVLALGGDAHYGGQPIPPEQIEMIYWYAEGGGELRRFVYDSAQFAADRALLRGLMDEIAARRSFPLTEVVERCRFCPYRSLCDRGVRAGPLDDYDGVDGDVDELSAFTLDLDQIAEIEF